ncbi:vWA domain-containing protein [Piscinibacter gummiphilus]|uniref:VWA domain-containing protein n=1 Tax=Piscinibacter gummiphilus TaxID=946333 RepID=A0ABZ0CZ07_9BURK|nr:VWA domain-containing protein [Piscinibacter gummiphilus]WOB09741.1 VWA domain-containing protein [Piscinibacter gummiphilus]
MKGILGGVLLAVLLTACGKKEAADAPKPADNKPVFTVLATTDLKDAQPLEAMVEKATGVRLRFTWGGTMESTEAVLSGSTPAHAAWFANAKYLLSDPQGQARVKLQEKIMLSPIAVGVNQTAAKQLGWDDAATAAKVGWREITQAASQGKLRYALSNPATSNQGFMALMGVVAAASQKSEALTAADVNRGAIASFLKGYKLPGDNSTYLTEKFLEQQGNNPTQLNAFINYESWLLSLNNGGKLREKLVLVYPHEGVATADYPFMLLKDERRDDYLKVVAYLKGADAQKWLARQTLRRPINAEVAATVADVLPKEGMRIELPFSPDRALADGLIDAYLNEFRRPIASTFVLDTSGSMDGQGRRAQLIQALHYVAGADSSLTGRLAKLTNREKVWMLPFSDQPWRMTYFEIPTGRPQAKGVQVQEDSEAKQAMLADVRAYADGLRMTGGTALYDSVLAALKHMLEQKQKNPNYQYSVVAFTDGENTKGRSLEQFQQAYAALPEDVRGIPVFMVLFGEAKEADLKALVQTTGGKVFDARKTPLYAVFKDIRAYQ